MYIHYTKHAWYTLPKVTLVGNAVPPISCSGILAPAPYSFTFSIVPEIECRSLNSPLFILRHSNSGTARA